MEPRRNPFAPDAGAPPPELAGRGEVLSSILLDLERKRLGRPSRSQMLVGLRGVGKTVLLNRILREATEVGLSAAYVECPEDRSLMAAMLAPLRRSLFDLSRRAAAQEAGRRALRVLASFVETVRLSYGGVEVRMEFEPEPGVADSRDLEHDLRDLIEAAGLAARSASSCLALFVDEIQYANERELAALITSLHRSSQLELPVTLVGAGLPQVTGKLGEAKSYAERLFEFRTIGALDPEDARRAIFKPLEHEGVAIEKHALDLIITETQGYPYFLQEWGKHTWDVARQSPIGEEDVTTASQRAIAALDDSFFRVRFERLTPSERRYLRAMSELGPGPHRSGDIAAELERRVTSVAPVRSQLINKGMVWSPGHGDTAFTVPLFDQFMKRTIPELET